jgi:hypothetical protein
MPRLSARVQARVAWSRAVVVALAAQGGGQGGQNLGDVPVVRGRFGEHRGGTQPVGGRVEVAAPEREPARDQGEPAEQGGAGVGDRADHRVDHGLGAVEVTGQAQRPAEVEAMCPTVK